MVDMTAAVAPKSDQLNYDDMQNGKEMVIKITAVSVNFNAQSQKISIQYENCGAKAYKPSVGMGRLIMDLWGEETDNWIGKSLKLFGDPTAMYGGKEQGGIRINAMSDINKAGEKPYVTVRRGTRKRQPIAYLDTTPQPTENDLTWINSIKAGTAKIEDITDESYRAYLSQFL